MLDIKNKNFYGLGRKKTSIARVYIREGLGRIEFNNQPLEKRLSKTNLLNKILLEPIVLIDKLENFIVKINVSGGGFSSQIDAARSGIAKALVNFSPDYKNTLKEFLKNDIRKVQRKVFGRRKSRKVRQYHRR